MGLWLFAISLVEYDPIAVALLIVGLGLISLLTRASRRAENVELVSMTRAAAPCLILGVCLVAAAPVKFDLNSAPCKVRVDEELMARGTRIATHWLE